MSSVDAAVTQAVASDRRDVQFSESAPYATGAEVKRRCGFNNPTPEYEIRLEVPGMRHAIPGAADLKTALDFLEGTTRSGI